MIEPQHRDMVLRMFARGLTIPSIYEAMGRVIRRSDIQLVIAEKSDADRRAAAILRREAAKVRLRRERIASEKALAEQIRARREAAALTFGFRILTIIPKAKKPEMQRKER